MRLPNPLPIICTKVQFMSGPFSAVLLSIRNPITQQGHNNNRFLLCRLIDNAILVYNGLEAAMGHCQDSRGDIQVTLIMIQAKRIEAMLSCSYVNYIADMPSLVQIAKTFAASTRSEKRILLTMAWRLMKKREKFKGSGVGRSIISSPANRGSDSDATSYEYVTFVSPSNPNGLANMSNLRVQIGEWRSPRGINVKYYYQFAPRKL